MPAEYSSQSHPNASDGCQQRQPVQPALVGQCRQREQRDRESDQGVREIELVVAVVQRVVGFLILFRCYAELLFLLRLVDGQRFVRGNRDAVALLLRLRSRGGG